MKKGSMLNAWADINSLLKTHKLINLGLILVCVLQVLIIGLMYFANPIVVFQSEKEQKYFMGHRAGVSISEEAIKQFVKSFLKIRYEWKNLDPTSMQKSLAPFVTKGLNEKLLKSLTHLKGEEFQGKETSQSIVNIDVNITEEKITSKFDKLLKIEGIPIPVPTTISLNIIRGTPNVWNPIGLLVNGIIEHQSK